MKKALFATLTLLLFTLHLSASEEAIRSSFNQYKNAILTTDGRSALPVLSDNTLSYYANLLKQVRYADAGSLSAMPLIDQLSVLMVRHKISADKLLRMSAADLLTYSINNGMVGKDSIQMLGLGEIIVEGKAAKGQMVINSKPTPIAFDFFDEGGTWKIDITSLMPMSNYALQNAIEQSGMTKEDFLINMISQTSETPPTPAIWQPLIAQ